MGEGKKKTTTSLRARNQAALWHHERKRQKHARAHRAPVHPEFEEPKEEKKEQHGKQHEPVAVAVHSHEKESKEQERKQDEKPEPEQKQQQPEGGGEIDDGAHTPTHEEIEQAKKMFAAGSRFKISDHEGQQEPQQQQPAQSEQPAPLASAETDADKPKESLSEPQAKQSNGDRAVVLFDAAAKPVNCLLRQLTSVHLLFCLFVCFQEQPAHYHQHSRKARLAQKQTNGKKHNNEETTQQSQFNTTLHTQQRINKEKNEKKVKKKKPKLCSK